jgi:alanyl-tRNA synthetase
MFCHLAGLTHFDALNPMLVSPKSNITWGGKDDFAQGGGSDRSKISAALEAIELAIAGK